MDGKEPSRRAGIPTLVQLPVFVRQGLQVTLLLDSATAIHGKVGDVGGRIVHISAAASTAACRDAVRGVADDQVAPPLWPEHDLHVSSIVATDDVVRVAVVRAGFVRVGTHDEMLRLCCVLYVDEDG